MEQASAASADDATSILTSGVSRQPTVREVSHPVATIDRAPSGGPHESSRTGSSLPEGATGLRLVAR